MTNVTLIDSMGTDLSVANAARVSFGKQINVMNEPDERLIAYLAKHNHWSPFSHCYVVFRIRAPIFVARQLVKHQVGLAWNEISRRYIDRTSLILDSFIVLIRGINCPPDNSLDYEGPFGPFAEVINSPRNIGLEPFPSVPPQKEGSIIKAGRIYNFETAAKFDGTKLSLYYNKSNRKQI